MTSTGTKIEMLLECTECHRKSVGVFEGDRCGMTQPDSNARTCSGVFQFARPAEKKSTATPFQILGIQCKCGVKTGLPDKGGDTITCHFCGRTYKLTKTGDGQSPAERYKAALAELDDWIRMLHTAPRSGAIEDDPEGSRTISISDTLAQNLCDCLRELRDTAVKGVRHEWD